MREIARISRVVNSAADRDSTIIIGRSPLLPLSAGYDIFAATDRARYLADMMRNDSRIILAIHIASPSLAADLIRDLERGAPSSRAIEKACRYIIRMATRSTPFGLFATVGNLLLGDGAEVLSMGGEVSSRSRVDSAVLHRCIVEIEADAELRRRLEYTLNGMTVERGTRLTILNPAATTAPQGADDAVDYTHTSLRMAPVVRHVMEQLRGRYLSFEDLQQSLGARFELSGERTARLLEQLAQAGLILSELRASPTDDLAGRVERFAARNAPGLAHVLRRVGAALRALDEYPLARRRPRHYAVIDAALKRVGATERTSIQLDARRDYSGSLPRDVADDIFRYGELLLTLSPPREFPRLRERFLRRFESDLPVVPLLEFLGSDVMNTEIEGKEIEAPVWLERRNGLLMTKIVECARRGSIACEITEDDIAVLAYPGDFEREAPYAQELLLEIHAETPSALSAGDYVIAPAGLAIGEYGPRLGRFTDVLGEGTLNRMRGGVASAADPYTISVELTYWPVWSRAFNVMTRQPIRDFELGLGVENRSGFVERLALDDVYVGLDRARFFLWSRRHGKRIDLRETHVFSSHGAPPLIRFLTTVRSDGRRAVMSLGGGAFATSPFFPRLTSGRFILTKARWSLFADVRRGRDAFAADVRDFRTAHHVPRWVSIVDTDRKLLIDMDSDFGLDMLFDASRGSGRALVLEEFLPQRYGSWMLGERGQYAFEVLATTIRPRGAKGDAREVEPSVDYAARALPPGEWLYYCIYCDEGDGDHLLVGEIAPFIDRLHADGLLQKWFFVRYWDPDFHLRVRVCVAGVDAQQKVLLAFNEMLATLVKTRLGRKFTLATYFRELERYGGQQNIERFETLFWHDSTAVIEELNRRPGTRSARFQAALNSIDPLISGLFRRSGRAGEWLAANRPRVRKLSSAMWEDVRGARASLGDRAVDSERAASMERTWDDILASGAFDRDEALWSALESVIHMHWNRFGIYGDAEHEIQAMLHGLQRSLVNRRERE
jgi:lantibiotic biosynthesis protein